MTSSSTLLRFRSLIAAGAFFFTGLLLAEAVSAAQYTIQLHNGTEIGTLRQPREASWDRSMVMVLTETGNWMAIPQQDIDVVIFEVERRQMGQVIDEKTVFLGLTRSADSEEDEEEEDSRDPLERFLEAQAQAQGQQGQDNSVRQFVRPGQAGGSGISASGVTPSSSSVFSYSSTTEDGGS